MSRNVLYSVRHLLAAAGEALHKVFGMWAVETSNDHARNELKHCLDRVCARAWTQLGVREGHGWWWRAAGHRRAFLSPYMSYQPAAAFAPAPTAYLTSHCQWQAHLDGTVQLVAFYSRTVAGGCCCSSSC